MVGHGRVGCGGRDGTVWPEAVLRNDVIGWREDVYHDGGGCCGGLPLRSGVCVICGFCLAVSGMEMGPEMEWE